MESVDPSRRRLGFEIVLVAILSFAFLAPGLERYSLVDPWETHYSEVGRRMLQDNDWVHTSWQKEGFASKPVLTFWLIAASMKSFGIASDGGYSGEIVENQKVLAAVRMPFVLFGVLGLVLIWFMLAKLVSRRVAWIGIVTVGSSPFFALVARQAITDMTLVGCMMGAVATFALANESADQPLAQLVRLPLGPARKLRLFAGSRHLVINAKHCWLFVVGGFLLWQAVYNFLYFTAQPQLAPGLKFPVPQFIIPGLIGLLGLLMWSAIWIRLDDDASRAGTSRLLMAFAMRRITTMRQIYMLWFYTFLGLSILGKGPAALGIFGIVGFFYILVMGKWSAIANGEFEIKRGLVLLLAIVVPWHLGMYLKEGLRFLNEYLITHLWARATLGVDNEKGTFNYYISQVGYGMYLWAALLPVAFSSLTKIRPTTTAGRAKLLVAIWAITTFAFFALVQTKFHHYILPAVPGLALLVAFFLDEVWQGKERFHPVYIFLGIGIVLLLTRDMMHEEKQWIEMFIFRYDRPWPSSAPWSIDATDGFLGLGLVGAVAIAFAGFASATRFARLAVVGVLATGLAIGLWAMHVYMPIAGTHWGMREAIRTYYERRQIYGEQLVYFGNGQAYDDWNDQGPIRVLRTMVPDHVQVGQPMNIRIQINSADPKLERTVEREITIPCQVTAIVDHRITVTIADAELAKVRDLVKAGEPGQKSRKEGIRPPVRVIDADRMVIWQGYWRGEVFWSGDEIMGWLPQMQTDWQLGDNDSKKLLKFLADPQLAPAGRRYFVFSSGNISGFGSMLTNPRARATLQTINTTSNKFSLGVFEQ